MNFENLNNMVNYIEEHLTDKIEYEDLARMIGVSEYSLQRIFIFLTNLSLSEYIRKRRLSKAFEELKTSNIKIIDLSIKYQYESSISFSRAFKNNFGITPTECRNSKDNYKQFSKIKFNNNIRESYNFEYEIKDIAEKEIYCYKVCSQNYDDLLFYIRDLYKRIRANNIYEKINENEMYGVFLYENGTYFYYLGSKTEYDNTNKFKIPKGKYAIFSVGSRNQNDILDITKKIYSQWLPSTQYTLNETLNKHFEFEQYVENNCYIYIPVIDKQN